METDSHMGVLFLFVFQVQTLYYSPDHKLVDGGLVIEGHSEVFGGEEDHLQFVQVPQRLYLASPLKPLLWCDILFDKFSPGFL